MEKYRDFFVDPDKTHTIKLTEEHWVKIKAEMSAADSERYENSLLNAEIKAGGDGSHKLTRRQRSEDSETHMTMNVGNLKLMEINIVEWSFKGVRPQPSTIGALKREWQDTIITAIEEQNSTNPLLESSQPLTEDSSSGMEESR